MASFAASEGGIALFECQLDDLPPQRCDEQVVVVKDETSATGYTLDGQSGLVYYERLLSNGTVSLLTSFSAEV
jgi:hypothetical protein